jgi:glycosyltransferase involved in cell wall biosynthesis
MMERHISIIIPNYNMAATIGQCLDAVFASDYENFEVIVIDDHSDDDSLEIIKKYPCTLVSLDERSGTSRARNTGARNSRGDVIFFIDADCLLKRDTLSIVNRTLSGKGPDYIIGGTYTRMPYDRTFFSIFQSVYVNYSETKNVENPDYIAAHAMIIDAVTFEKSGGFREDFLPIIEDVEFSHRMRRAGCKLIMNPEIQVQHIFNFSLLSSLRNAFKKTTYWNIYSLQNKDLFVDSGSASIELKVNVSLYFLGAIFILLSVVYKKTVFLYVLPFFLGINILLNRRLFRAFHETGGALFACLAIANYVLLYPVPIGFGTFAGLMKFLLKHRD